MDYVIIPSKNTYQKKHPFQKDNVISKISVSAMGEVNGNKMKNQSNIEHNTTIASYDVGLSEDVSTEEQRVYSKYSWDQDFNYVTKNYIAVWYARVILSNIAKRKVTLPQIAKKHSEDGYYIQNSVNLDSSNISATYRKTTQKYKPIESTISASVPNNAGLIASLSFKSGATFIPEGEEQTEIISGFRMPKGTDFSFTNPSFKGDYRKDTSYKVSLDYNYTAETIPPTVQDNDAYFTVSEFDVLDKITFQYLRSSAEFDDLVWLKNEYKDKDTTASLDIVTYKLESLTVNVNGDKISLNLEEKEQNYIGDSNLQGKYEQEDVISFGSGNELFQNTSYISQTGKTGTIPNEFAKSIFKHYRNGKETATILCGINDYFYNDTQNSPFILVDNPQGGTSKRITFDLHDKVIPMVYTAQGKDIPMSYNSDGTPKAFQVLGVRYFYDGAVWQELNLQEI